MPAPLAQEISARGPYPGNRYYQLLTESCGGNVLNWAVQALGFGDDYAAFFAQALSAPDERRGVRFTPDLPSGAGHWDGMGLQHTRADLARAVVDALTTRIAALITRLQPERSTILLAGGGSRIPAWVDYLSGTIGEALQPIPADSLLGAAMMARTALRQ
jgi:sugar (pentulose or hexulose) kinase